MKPLTAVALAMLCAAGPWHAQAQSSITPTFRQDGRECRTYPSQIRVGAGAEDSYDILCKQPDGTWIKLAPRAQEEHASGSRDSHGGIRVGDGVTAYGAQRDSRHRSNTRVYSGQPDMPLELVIEDNIPAFVVIDPYRYHHDRYKRSWSDGKRHFNQHHNGPGWQKHWKHHEKAMDKD